MNKRNLALILSMFCISNVYALVPPISNYAQLVTALEMGANVRAIVHIERCQISDPLLQSQLAQNIDGATTAFNFEKYLHYKARINGQLRDTVTTSLSFNIEQASGVLWLVHARLNVFEDETATIHANYYDSINNQEQLAIDLTCEISNGRDDKGLYLYESQ